MGIIKHLAEFLGLLSMPCRISYLPLLDEILKKASPYNWRLRKSLASQLPALVLLPPPSNVYSTLFPLAMALLQDPVAEVRIESFRGVAQLFCVLQPGYVPQYTASDGTAPGPISVEEGISYLNGVSRAINSLTHSETYQHRQLWAELAVILLRYVPKELFEQYFLEYILRLTSDSVLNVRIAVARLLAGWKVTSCVAPWECNEVEDSVKSCPWKWLLDRGDIKECIQRLSHDDNDVYLAIVNLQPLFPDVEFQSISCRGLKAAPGGPMPVQGENRYERESDIAQSEGRVSRASSLSSHDEVNISGPFLRSHSSTQLATPVTIPNLGVLRVDEVEFNLDADMEPDLLDIDYSPIQIHSHLSSEDYDYEEEQRIALRDLTIAGQTYKEIPSDTPTVESSETQEVLPSPELYGSDREEPQAIQTNEIQEIQQEVSENNDAY